MGRLRTPGGTSGKQSLLNDVLVCLARCALTALQSSISVAVALHALDQNDSTCWAVFTVCVLACTILCLLMTPHAGLARHSCCSAAQQSLAHQQ